MHNEAENKTNKQKKSKQLSIFLCNIIAQLNHKIGLCNFNSY